MKLIPSRRSGVILFIFLVIFLQPSIQCGQKDKRTAGKQSKNPIYALDENAGIQWKASAPDQVLASETKLQPQAKEVSDADMNYLEKADMKGGEYVFSAAA